MIRLKKLSRLYENYPAAFLFCEECQDQSSHNPLDYSTLPEDFPFRCNKCGKDLVLAERKTEIICS